MASGFRRTLNPSCADRSQHVERAQLTSLIPVALNRFPKTLSKKYHPAFTAVLAPLIISHSAELPSEPSQNGGLSEEAGSGAAAPTLGTYSPLWTKSLFTTHEQLAPMPADNLTPPGWATDFELSGWTRVDGQLTVYLTRRSNGQTIVLYENDLESPDTPRLIALNGEDTILDGKARVSMNGEMAWISLNQGVSTHTHQPGNPDALKAAPDTSQDSKDVLEPPTTVDSRAARLNGPVLLDASATYESFLTPPAEPAPTAVERLRQRREKLIRDFPRRSRP